MFVVSAFLTLVIGLCVSSVSSTDKIKVYGTTQNRTILFSGNKITGVFEGPTSTVSWSVRFERLPDITFLQLESDSWTEGNPIIDLIDSAGNKLFLYKTYFTAKQIIMNESVTLKFTGKPSPLTVNFTLSKVHPLHKFTRCSEYQDGEKLDVKLNPSGYISSSDNFTLTENSGTQCAYESRGYTQNIHNTIMFKYTDQMAVGLSVEWIAYNLASEDNETFCSYDKLKDAVQLQLLNYTEPSYLRITADGTETDDWDVDGRREIFLHVKQFYCGCLKHIKDRTFTFNIRHMKWEPKIEFVSVTENIKNGFLLRYEFIICDVKGRDFKSIHRLSPSLFFAVACLPGFKLFDGGESEGEIECSWDGRWRRDPRCLPENSTVWTDKSTAANIGYALTTDAIISSSVHHLEATVIPVVTLITLVVCAAAVGIIWRRCRKPTPADQVELELTDAENSDSDECNEGSDIIEIDDLTTDNITQTAAKLKRSGLKHSACIVEFHQSQNNGIDMGATSSYTHQT